MSFSRHHTQNLQTTKMVQLFRPTLYSTEGIRNSVQYLTRHKQILIDWAKFNVPPNTSLKYLPEN